MSEGSWLADQRSELATERILDAAAEVFVRQGVAQASMGDVARAAGCSRATVYRYFDDRQALRVAFVHRETRRVAAGVGAAIAGIDDPSARIVEAIMGAVAEVRARPTLSAWFVSGNAELTSDLVGGSAVIHGLAVGMLDEGDGDGDGGRDHDRDRGRDDRARWLVRVVTSLIASPGAGESDERALLERFVAPVLAVGPTQRGHSLPPSRRGSRPG